jgi:hypothetical protein
VTPVGRAVTARGTIFLLLASVLLFGADCNAQAQTETVAPAQAHQQLGREQLDQLVAPIALYPDNLLSEILMASTYPLEVVQAERWLKANKGLKGDKLKDAVDKQPWDDSVKSLIATPSVLDMLSSKIDWTQTLGRAVIDQQGEVMDAVQRLRAKAQANNKLQSGEQQKVVVRQPAAAPRPTQAAVELAPLSPDQSRSPSTLNTKPPKVGGLFRGFGCPL